MRMRLAILGFVVLVPACGGGSPPPASAGTGQAPDKDASAAAPAADAGGDDIKPFAGVDLGEPAPAASSSAPATPPPPEPKDECTPVGVDFEKKLRPKFNECYREGKKKNPNLEGTVRIAVSIDTLGKVKGIRITEKTFPDDVANCMLGVVKKSGFPEASKCPGKDITIPIKRPTNG